MFPPYALKKSGIVTDYYFGQPQDTIYSQPDSIYLPKPEDVEHLANGGKLIQIFGDNEASDKNARTATIKGFAALAFDLQGRLLAKIKVPVAIPDHAVYAIDAAMVAQVDAKDLDKGFPEHFAVTQIHDFFKQTSHLDVTALNLELKENSGGKLYTYPLNLAGGQSLTLNIQTDGKKFRIDGVDTAHKIYGHWQPFNGEGYDNPLLAHTSAGLGFSNLYPATQKRNNMICSDVHVKSMWVWAFGPQGDAGLQLGERQHKATRRIVVGSRLEDIVENNTVAANRARGVPGGIRLYDGREFDKENTHDEYEDAALTAAATFELRRLDPQGMRFIEEIDDADKYKKFLQGNQGFADRPPVGFIHFDQGMLTRSIGVLMATDDTYGDRRKAVLFNLAHDPKDYVNKTNDEIRALLKQKDNEPVFVPLELNKTSKVATFERAYAAGAGQDISPEEYHRRAMMITNNRAFIRRVMENWYDLTSPTPPTKLLTQRQPHEDSFSHFGEPKFYRVKKDGRSKNEPKDIYKRRLQVWRTFNKFDNLLNLATEGHAVEYSNDPKAVADYLKRYKDVAKKLAQHQEHWVRRFQLPPSGGVASLDTARQHLWMTREACMDARFSPYSSESWVVNERGQRQLWDHVIAMSAATRKRMWPVREDLMGDKPHFRIQFERNPERYTIITALLAFSTDKFYQTHGSKVKPEWWDAYFKKSWEPSRKWYNAYVTRAVQGPPNLNPAEHKIPSEASELQRIDRMMTAAAAEMSREYKRALDTPQGQQRLAGHRKFKTKRLAQYVWDANSKALTGFDAKTNQPAPNLRFLVNPAKTVRITVPDAMLENPNWHEIWGQHHVIANGQDTKAAFDKLANPDISLLLVGKATGMMRLAAKAVCTRLPKGTDAAEASTVAQSAYATIGAKLGPHPFLLTFEQLAPVHKANENEKDTQHVALPSLDWAGLVDTQAGGLPEPLTVRTGLIVRDVGQDFTKGPIRLRRTQGGIETGDEYQGTVAKATRITVDDITKMKDEEAWRFGKLSSGDLQAQWKRLYAELHVEPGKQSLWKIELAAPVDQNTCTYINRAEPPIAMIGKPPRTRRISSHQKPGVAA
ncbi:MAG: hypothetical protein WCD70_02195 [Alphaproteobacteria bacterium]